MRRANKVKYLLILLVVLNVLDAFLTHFLIKLNLATEGNMFLESIVGEPLFFIVKIVGAFLAALILWDISRRHPKLGKMAIHLSVTVYTLIVLWNTSLFII
jgi:hypothetical protein